MTQVKVLFYPAGHLPPETRIISNDLEGMKGLTGGGWIEMVPLADGIDLVCDEEGKLKGLPPNRPIFGGQDVVCGPFFIVRVDDEGEAVDMTPEDIAAWENL